MAYRLRQQESIPGGLRRVARNELKSARSELRRRTPPDDEAIHEARKRVKKVRAIVELLEADGGRGLVKCQKRLRAVNGTLSRLRDADAMLATLTKLRKRNPRLFSEHTFARLRRQLASHKQDAMQAADRDGTWKTTGSELRKLQRAVRRWRPAHRRFGALAAGIRLAHRQGRKAMARAQGSQGAADFHEWRKQIKVLWYQLRLVEDCSSTLRRDVETLHRAETWLGDDHNVVVLCAELSKDASICGGPVDLDRLRLAADRYQCNLRKKALDRTRRLYGSRSGNYLRRIERAWKAWRRQSAARSGGVRRTAA